MNTKVIEINGVKMEVDMRYAKRVDEIRVGTRVKVLRKEYSSYKVLHGIVIGFEPFKQLPTIIVAAARVDYSEAKVEFIYYNAKTEDTEIVVACDDDIADLDKNDFVKKVDSEIAKKQNEIKELEARKEYFLEKFKSYWQPIEDAVAEAVS
jgi:hypothetical protein